jgi:hypothetical protein
MKTEGLSSREKLLLGLFHKYLGKLNKDYLNDILLAKEKDNNLNPLTHPITSNKEVRGPV